MMRGFGDGTREFGALLEKVAAQTPAPSRSGPRDYAIVRDRAALIAMIAELTAAPRAAAV